MQKKKVVIIGVTGSIGETTIKIIKQHPDKFELCGIIANSNYKRLAEIANEFDVKHVAINTEAFYPALKERLHNKNVKIYSGMEGCLEVASLKSDIVISASVGIHGLIPTVHAIKNTKVLALANKEPMVCAGKIINHIAWEYGTQILPIDSEHNAVFQCMEKDVTDVSKVILTASGGPFLRKPKEEFKNVTLEEACKHPNWSMGRKVTIDSATLANKGLELIEAFYLFNLKPEQLDAVIHSQSLIHSIVNFKDGSSLMQMSHPNMIIPISYIMGFPNRITNGYDNIDLLKVGSLQFEEIDCEKFVAFKLAKQVLHSQEQALMIAYNMANEFAVEQFVNNKISFTDITRIIEEVLGMVKVQPILELEDVIHYKDYVLEVCESIFSSSINN